MILERTLREIGVLWLEGKGTLHSNLKVSVMEWKMASDRYHFGSPWFAGQARVV